jgi:hypothetical protein
MKTRCAGIIRRTFLQGAIMEFKKGKYRHFKGKEYELLDVALHSETMEPMVVYRALYGEQGLWVRPAAMWNETVLHEGKEVRRFTWIGEE